MKRIFLATVAVLAATVAQAETIYVMPGTAVQRATKTPFKTAISGDDELLVVHPGATNQDLMIVANHPDGTVTASANVLLIDDHGKVVENLRVIVTPFDAPSRTVQVVRVGKPQLSVRRQYCVNAKAAKSRNKGRGDADSETVTKHRDGSTSTTKTWVTAR